MDEMAFSLDGENAHYGAPENPAAPGRAAGGSSTGSAVSLCRPKPNSDNSGVQNEVCMSSWASLHQCAEDYSSTRVGRPHTAVAGIWNPNCLRHAGGSRIRGG